MRAPKGKAAELQSPKQNLKIDTSFVVTMISNVLRDLPSSRNQPLKSAEEKHIIILKNKDVWCKL